MAASGSQSSSSDDDDFYSSPTRISEQLQALQSLIPNINQGDERSILEDAREYLRRIHEETEQIERELSQEPGGCPSSSSGGRRPRIIRVEAEQVAERRFVVKVAWRRGPAGAGHVQRVIECVGVQMTSVVVNESNPDEMLTTAFVKTKKGTTTTEEELYDLIIAEARRYGLLS